MHLSGLDRVCQQPPSFRTSDRRFHAQILLYLLFIRLQIYALIEGARSWKFTCGMTAAIRACRVL